MLFLYKSTNGAKNDVEKVSVKYVVLKEVL